MCEWHFLSLYYFWLFSWFLCRGLGLFSWGLLSWSLFLLEVGEALNLLNCEGFLCIRFAKNQRYG